MKLSRSNAAIKPFRFIVQNRDITPDTWASLILYECWNAGGQATKGSGTSVILWQTEDFLVVRWIVDPQVSGEAIYYITRILYKDKPYWYEHVEFESLVDPLSKTYQAQIQRCMFHTHADQVFFMSETGKIANTTEMQSQISCRINSETLVSNQTFSWFLQINKTTSEALGTIMLNGDPPYLMFDTGYYEAQPSQFWSLGAEDLPFLLPEGFKSWEDHIVYPYEASDPDNPYEELADLAEQLFSSIYETEEIENPWSWAGYWNLSDTYRHVALSNSITQLIYGYGSAYCTDQFNYVFYNQTMFEGFPQGIYPYTDTEYENLNFHFYPETRIIMYHKNDTRANLGKQAVGRCYNETLLSDTVSSNPQVSFLTNDTTLYSFPVENNITMQTSDDSAWYTVKVKSYPTETLNLTKVGVVFYHVWLDEDKNIFQYSHQITQLNDTFWDVSYSDYNDNWWGLTVGSPDAISVWNGSKSYSQLGSQNDYFKPLPAWIFFMLNETTQQEYGTTDNWNLTLQVYPHYGKVDSIDDLPAVHGSIPTDPFFKGKNYLLKNPMLYIRMDNHENVTTSHYCLESCIFNDDKLTFTVSAPSGGTSTTKVYCGSKGKPTSVTGADSWSYDSDTKICTVSVTHSSSQTVTLDWSIPTTYWNPSVTIIWGIVPILFIVGTSLSFIVYKRKDKTIVLDIVTVSIAFLFFAILIPIILDLGWYG